MFKAKTMEKVSLSCRCWSFHMLLAILLFSPTAAAAVLLTTMLYILEVRVRTKTTELAACTCDACQLVPVRSYLYAGADVNTIKRQIKRLYTVHGVHSCQPSLMVNTLHSTRKPDSSATCQPLVDLKTMVEAHTGHARTWTGID